MSANGINSAEDADMVDGDGEKVVTMMDVLQEQQEFEEDANAVLGASDEKNCTYPKGYIKRQAIYACITCCPDAKDDPTKRAGVCLACSLNCHENHELVELYTKRNFRCDCGNPKFNSNPCQFTQNKPDLNEDNYYNQNFSGLYCTCRRPYPDPECTEEDEMIQCIICEDWLHATHLEATIPTNEQYSEMVCRGCMEKNEFLHDYSDIAINNELGDIDVINISSTISLNDTNECNGIKDIVTQSTDCDLPQKNLSDNTLNNGTSINLNMVNEELPRVDSNGEEQSEKNESKDKSIVSEHVDNNLTDIVQEQSLENNLPSDVLEDSVNNSEADVDKQNSTAINKENTNEEQITSNDSTDTVHQTTESVDVPDNNITAESPKGLSEHITVPESSEDTGAKNVHLDDIDSGNSSVNTNNKELEDANDDMSTQPKMQEGSLEENNDTIEPNTTKDVETESETKAIDNNDNVNMESSTADADKKPNEDLQTELEMNIDVNKDTAAESSETNEKEVVEEHTGLSNKEVDSSETNGMEVEENTTIDKAVYNSETNKTELVEENTVTSDKAVDSRKTNEKEVVEDNRVIGTPEICSVETSTQENKRKLSVEQSDAEEVTAKKVKLEENKSCSRPIGVKKRFKGATFWPSNFRQKLCTCNECISMYKDLSVLFLIDPEDTVTAYEALGKENTAVSQYEKGLEALSSLDRIQQINALTEYNKMRDKLLDFLKSFKDRKEIVKEEDIKAFFAGMKPKREPDGVYFCR